MIPLAQELVKAILVQIDALQAALLAAKAEGLTPTAHMEVLLAQLREDAEALGGEMAPLP